MRRADGHQSRDPRTHAGHICNGMPSIQSAHAVREDVHLPSRRQREDGGRKLSAALRNGTDGIDRWLLDDMALAPEMIADAVEVVDEGRNRDAPAKAEHPMRENDELGSHLVGSVCRDD